MKPIFRTALAVITLFAALAAASTASAVTVLNPGTFVGTTSSTTFTASPSGQTIRCTGSRITKTENSDGSGSVPAGGAIFSGCSNALLGNFTVTQNGAWRDVLSFIPPNTFRLLLTVSATLSNPLCRFNVTGGVLITITGSGLISVSSLTVSQSTLTISGVSGCLGVINNGNTGDFRATYALNRAALVSQ